MDLNDVIFYTRRDCPLCDKVEAVLRGSQIEVSKMFVDEDPALAERYGDSVPVLVRRGETIFEGGMDPADIPELLAH